MFPNRIHHIQIKRSLHDVVVYYHVKWGHPLAATLAALYEFVDMIFLCRRYAYLSPFPVVCPPYLMLWLPFVSLSSADDRNFVVCGEAFPFYYMDWDFNSGLKSQIRVSSIVMIYLGIPRLHFNICWAAAFPLPFITHINLHSYSEEPSGHRSFFSVKLGPYVAWYMFVMCDASMCLKRFVESDTYTWCGNAPVGRRNLWFDECVVYYTHFRERMFESQKQNRT